MRAASWPGEMAHASHLEGHSAGVTTVFPVLRYHSVGKPPAASGAETDWHAGFDKPVLLT